MTGTAPHVEVYALAARVDGAAVYLDGDLAGAAVIAAQDAVATGVGDGSRLQDQLFFSGAAPDLLLAGDRAGAGAGVDTVR